MEKTMQPQELTKEPMVELDTGGNAVDIELKEEQPARSQVPKDENEAIELGSALRFIQLKEKDNESDRGGR